MEGCRRSTEEQQTAVRRRYVVWGVSVGELGDAAMARVSSRLLVAREEDGTVQYSIVQCSMLRSGDDAAVEEMAGASISCISCMSRGWHHGPRAC